MKINNVSKSDNKLLKFGSRNNPIAPFVIQTLKGPLFVSEIKQKDIPQTVNFELDCLTKSVKAWMPYQKDDDYYKEFFLGFLSKILNHCKRRKDGNSTILIAKDTDNQVKSLFVMQSLDTSILKNIRDPKTGYIDSCFVSEEYRSQGIGKILVDKLIETCKGTFSDIYLAADNAAVNFYKKTGFAPLDTTNPEIMKVSDYILNSRSDKELITIMSKSLDASNPWYTRLAKLIK